MLITDFIFIFSCSVLVLLFSCLTSFYRKDMALDLGKQLEFSLIQVCKLKI